MKSALAILLVGIVLAIGPAVVLACGDHEEKKPKSEETVKAGDSEAQSQTANEATQSEVAADKRGTLFNPVNASESEPLTQ